MKLERDISENLILKYFMIVIFLRNLVKLTDIFRHNSHCLL